MKLTYSISELIPYINWVYYYHAWQVKEHDEQHRLHSEALHWLCQLEDRYHAYALFELFFAHSDGDDIVVYGGGNLMSGECRIPCLRQQQGEPPYLCLADFVAPKNVIPHLSPLNSKLGVFATSVDRGMETDFSDDPYCKMTAQLLADRLAEAAAERMHEEVRKTYWGYAPDEHLSIADLHAERFQGIRPAVGYPSLPDTSLNFVIDQLLQMQQIGIRLTESGAMRPHASVSGFILSHPKARYFSLGPIGEDQLADYARRRGVPVSLMRKFLGGNIQ
jgi:cobalamin-dependent methionine synthase I